MPRLRSSFLSLASVLLLGLPVCSRGQGGMVPVGEVQDLEPAAEAGVEAGAASTESVEMPTAGDPMSQLLHWAVQNSDPEKLKELMKKYQEHNLTLKDVYGQDVLDAMFVDEGSEMLGLIAQVSDFRNESVEDEELENAMERLQEFIEQIDNAGNLHRMGGLSPLLEIGLTTVRPPPTRAMALWTLGIAVQNNPPVQEDVLSLDGLRRLSASLSHCGEVESDLQYCGKLIFATSALVKNNATTQAEASSLGVFDWLLEVGVGHRSLSVAKKCIGLLETVLAQNPDVPFLKTLAGKQTTLAQSLLKHVRGESGAEETDTDTAEKALRLVTRLLSLRPMLFPPDFKPGLQAAVQVSLARCERAFGAEDELCTGLQELADSAALMLTAREVTDEEL